MYNIEKNPERGCGNKGPYTITKPCREAIAVQKFHEAVPTHGVEGLLDVKLEREEMSF
jgi:hypothetical protein